MGRAMGMGISIASTIATLVPLGAGSAHVPGMAFKALQL